MKLNKLISITASIAILMSSASIASLPTAFAATDEETRTFTEDFEGMELTALENNLPTAESGKATIDALMADGWWAVDNNKAYTPGSGGTPDTSDALFHFAAVMSENSNKFLRINTPKSSTANYKLGLGRLFPGQGTNAKGVWEIDFKFRAYAKGATKAQFNFSMNTYNAQLDEAVAQHNIISAYNNKMYLGYRDYFALYDGAGVPQGRIDKNVSPDWWFDVKVIVNCDAKYYSVDLSHDGALIARRGAISFAGDETIGFFKLSALGMGQPSAVFVDDISIKPAENETLIYNEDFEALQNVELAPDGITTGGETEDVSGHSYFEGFTPWRAHSEIGNNYEIQDDPDLVSRVVKLGGDETGSGLVYMQAYENLVTADTQPVRGKVKTSFKIKPENAALGAKVNVIGDCTQDITDEDAVAFEIADNSGTPALVKEDGSLADLDSSTWYDVDLVFDVVEGTVETTVKADGGDEIASFVKSVVTIDAADALKGIMFNVPAGSSVLADDIAIEYDAASAAPEPTTEATAEPAPAVGAIKAVDRDSAAVTDINNVPLNLWAIQIPFGCTLDPATANTSTITFLDENRNPIPYRAKIEKNSYFIYLDEEGLLTAGTQYQITVPATVANIAGDTLGQEYKFKFTTAGEKPKPVVGSIVAVDKDSTQITDINNVPLNLWAVKIPFGCTLDPSTANADTITFMSENMDVIPYRAVIKDNAYYIYLDEEGLLEEGTQSQITVPATVANTSGDEFGQEFKFKFTTTGSSAPDPAPVVGKIAAVDRDSNPVTDINSVPLNLWAIQIPFGCTLDPETANTNTITFMDEYRNPITYRAKIEKNAYYIYLDEEGLLEGGTQYQITVPATVANTAGDTLGQEYKFKFTTEGSKPAPVVGAIVAVDKGGKQITDIESVPLNLWAIKIPFGCTLDPSTANADTITFMSENMDVIPYRAVIKDKAYYIYLDEEGLLEEGTEYQITVPGTVANLAGGELGDEFQFKFKTAASVYGAVSISAVKVNDSPVTALSDITPGSTVAVEVECSEERSGTAVMAFYKEGKLAGLLKVDKDLTAEDKTFEFEVPSELDMAEIDKASIFLWNGFTSIAAYCESVSFE